MKTKEIFRNCHYSACVMRDGSLVVTSNAVQKGICLAPGETAEEWIHAIETAIDDGERHALCRALMNARDTGGVMQ